MITVSAGVTADLLESATDALAWYVDIEPFDSVYDARTPSKFRLGTETVKTSAVDTTNFLPYPGAGYYVGNHLKLPPRFKKTLGSEFDKYSINIQSSGSGVTDTTLNKLLEEYKYGAFDNATVRIYLYINSESILIDVCRVNKYSLNDGTLLLNCTNELNAFRGKLPATPHTPQAWNAVEDRYDNPNPSAIWQQLDTQVDSSGTGGRKRKGAQSTDSRNGFYERWSPGELGDDETYYYPIAYGQHVIMKLDHDRYGHTVLSEGDCEYLHNVMSKDGENYYTNQDKSFEYPDQSEWDDDRTDVYGYDGFVTRSDQWPQYSALSGWTWGLGTTDEGYVVYTGRKHYEFVFSGTAGQEGDETKWTASNFGSQHSGVTNPIWVFVDLCMNILGLEASSIDFESAKTIADELASEGYDLRFILDYKNRMEIKDVLNKIAVNGSFLWHWWAGKIYFTRRRASDDADFIAGGGDSGWLLTFQDDDIKEGSASHSDQSIEFAPNKFIIKYLKNGLSDGRYYHRILEHVFKVEEHIYVKEKSKNIDLGWLASSTDFGDPTGGSLPQLEALKEMRMARAQDKVKIDTYNLNAMLLQPGDPVKITSTLTLNALNMTDEEFEVESMSYDGKDTVSLTLKSRDDSWFDPDPNASIDTNMDWTLTGAAEANVPSYRFIAIAGDVSSGVLIQNFEADDTLNGGLDDRALAPGNVLWAEDYTTTHRDWDTVSSSTGTTRYWKPLGIIASTEESELFGVPGIYVEFEETIWNSGLVAQYHRIQCQPHSTFYADAKTERGGSKDQFFNMVMNLNFTNVWNYAAGAVDMAASSDGGAAYTDLNNNPVWALGPSNQSSTFEISGFSKTSYLSDAFPGCCSFKILTKNGIQGTEDIYVFSESLGVSKEGGDDAKISFLAYPFCDFTEIGMILQTDWDEQENPNVTFKIEFDTGATFSAGEGIVYGYTGVDPATYAPQPPFKEQFFSKIISGSVTVPATPTVFYDLTDYTLAALKIGTQITLRLTTYDSSGSVIDTDDITLTRRNRQFENYLGTINKATGHKGAGMLMATTNWGLFADTWTKNSSGVNDYSNWSGGIYVYPKDPSDTRIDPTAWTRYGVDPQTGLAVDTGPSFAVETSGETKLAYFNNAGADSGSGGTYYESGALFYTFPDSASRHTYRGEFLLGLGKAFGGLCAWNATTSLQSSPTNTLATGLDGSGSGYEYRGAALRVLRNGTYYTSNSWKPLVHAFHLAVDGLLIGGGALHQNSVSDTMDPESSSGVVLYTANGNTHIPTYDSSNFLAGWTDTGSGTRWHSYAYVQTNGSTAEGLIIPSAANGVAYAGDHRVLKIQTKLGSDSSVRPYYAHLSESENYVYIPGASSGDGYLHYNNADLEYNWGGSIWKTLLTTDLYNYDPTTSSKYYLLEQGAKDTVIFPNRTLILPAASANFQCCLYDDGTDIYFAAVHNGTWKKVQLT